MRRALIAVALAMAVVCGPARADMYTVSGVAIEAIAESPVEAKQVAIAQGQAKAFTQLLRRLTSSQDASALPQPDNEALQSVVAGYSLDNERTSATQYLADLTVRFNADAVEFLMSQSNLRLSVEQAPPALVIPVLWSGGEARIWDDNNPWRAVWERLDLENRLVPALLPLGDSADELIDANSLARGDPAALELIGGRYGVDFAFVSIVAYDLESGRIEAALTGGGPRGPMDLRENGTIEAGSEQEAMAAIARTLLDRLDSEWRAAVESDPANQDRQTVALGVPFANLREWVGIRSRIETAPGVDTVDVRSLNASGAQIAVTFSGGLRELAASLEVQGLYLRDDGANWVISTN